jgi:hypothetical protein
LYTLKVLILSLNIYSIILISNWFYSFDKQKIQDSNKIIRIVINFSTIWFGQSLIFYWTLLIQFESKNSIVLLTRIIILIPILTIIILILSKQIILNLRKILVFPLIFLTFQIYFSIKQNAWDDLAYHVPVELMIRDSGSLWNWPDIIYAQWGLIGGDVSNALHAIAFNEFQFDRLNSLFSFLILMFLAVSFKSLQAKVVAIILFLSVPAILQQVGSRYVDALLAWALFVVFILIWNQKKGIPLSRLNGFLIFVSMAFSLSIKYSALIPILILITYLFYKTRSSMALMTTVSVGAFLTAVGPIWIRNYVEHNNYLYPYYLRDESAGYMRFTSTSDILTSIYKNSMGMAKQSDFIVFIYQYFASPIETSYLLVKQAIFNNVSDFQDVYYKVFTYDNRIGGFGPAVIILILLIVGMHGTKSLPRALILILITSQIPVIIHPRYHLIIFTILVFIAAKNYSTHIISRYTFILISGLMSVVALFAMANVNEFLKRITAPTNFTEGAQRINPSCLNVIKLGSDVWFGANLWGPNYCGKVLSGNFVYQNEIELNSLGSGVEIPKQPYLEINEITEIKNQINLNRESTLVVCASSALKTNTFGNLMLLEPCEILVRHLDESEYRFVVGEIFEETFSGPLLQIITIDRVLKS